MLIFILLGFLVLILKRKEIETKPLDHKFLTGTNSIYYGIIILLVYTAFILIGTSMPIISGLILPTASNVQQNYYNAISIPFGILIMTILIIAATFRSGFKNNPARIAAAILSIALSFLMNIFFTTNAAAYIFIALGFYLIFLNIADIIVMKASVYASRLAHLGIGLMIIGIITSNIHSYSVQKEIVRDVATDIDSITLTFKDYTTVKGIKMFESSSDGGLTALTFLYKKNNLSEEIATPYFINKKMNSLMREPYIDYGFLNDIYISPIEYKNKSETEGNFVISKGEEKIINNVKIKFIAFEIDKEQMRSGHPKVFANLIVRVNNRDYKVNPGMAFNGNNRTPINAIIPGIKKKISHLDMDFHNKEILLNMEPDKNISAPPATVLVDVSFKRMVWLVWLGTILIAAGGIVAIRKK